ncbi:MAG: Y-family DNA polymerase [Chitinophagaceae bacterium]|nr:Y-family DNA polymerase [Chitinophagaceae bacterium]
MIALVDINNFYAACERMFNPSLNGRPIVVLSNNDGCAIARSEEAKALGVQMGTPIGKLKQLIKDKSLAVYSSNYTLYGSMSQRVMTLLRGFAANVEVYSIDEAFLECTGMSTEKLNSWARKIRETILSHTGLPVSVGIAPTKALAKMANHFAKKHNRQVGVWVVNDRAATDKLLHDTAIDDIWGIGWQYQKLLKGKGVNTAAEFVQLPDAWIRNNMTVMSLRLAFELRGVNAFKWEETPDSRKNICTSRAFQERLTSLKQLEAPVASHAATCSRKLRAEKSCAKNLHVFIHTNPFNSKDAQHSASITIPLATPTSSSQELVKYAIMGLRRIYQPGYNYHKCGVIVMDLVPEQTIQLSLFDERDRPKEARLMKALDKTNTRFGKDVVRYAAHGYDTAWHLRARRLSSRYTTRLEEIMIVKS